MKKVLVLVLCFVTLALCACGSKNKGSSYEADPLFNSEAEIKEFFNGSWMHDNYRLVSDQYYMYTIEDDKIVEYKTELMDSFLAEMESLSGAELKSTSSDELVEKYITENSYEITYDLEKGELSANNGGISLSADLDENEISYFYATVDEPREILKKLCDNKLTQLTLEYDYPGIATAKDAQYDKYGYLGKNFLVSGSAELDDYYNYDYRDLDAVYFCIKIRPEGGTYSDEWYIYASRTEFAALFESLKEGSKSVNLVAQIQFPDTGSNNMATLVDFYPVW